jgi:tetraacyldisaccharide 4'-kinase
MSSTVVATLRRSIARRLESASSSTERPSRWESLLSRTELASPLRALALPAQAAVVGVGGATLGGSGRTPVAIALVSALADRGLRVALIAHGHGARALGGVCTVGSESAIDDVGDEALIAARALGDRATVLVAQARGEAMAHAAKTHDVLVVDRLLQTSPARLARSLLVVDRDAPWGSGRMIPFGDLSAPRAALLQACDEVVSIGSNDATSVVLGFLHDRRIRSAESLRDVRIGLVTSLARPHRVVASLGALELHPVVHVERDDHGRGSAGEVRRLSALARRARVDLWLLDAKSAMHLDLGGLAATIDHRVVLSPAIVDRVATRVAVTTSSS